MLSESARRTLFTDARVRTGLLLAVLLLAALAPRMIRQWGIQQTHCLEFMDMNSHLLNLTMVSRQVNHPGWVRDDPYLQRRPGALQTTNLVQWPPGLYYLASLFEGPLGPLNTSTIQLTNGVFLLILLLAVVGIGAELANLRVGLWAALLTAWCPAFVADWWYLSLDFPLVAMTTMGLLLLLQTRWLTRPGPCLAFGIWGALGLMVKLTYAAYLLLPGVYVLVVALRRRPVGWRRPLANLGLGLGAALLMILLLQPLPVENIWGIFKAHMFTPHSPAEPGLSIRAIPALSPLGLTAVAQFALMNFPFPLVLLALPGLVAAHRRAHRASLGPALMLFWGTYLFMTLMLHRQERYIQPMYPALTLLTAWWVLCCAPRRARRLLIFGVGAAYGAVLLLTHYHPTPWPWPLKATAWVNAISLDMPQREELAALRAKRFHTFCDLDALAPTLERLAPMLPRNQVVAVMSSGGDISEERVVLLANQLLRGPLFIHWPSAMVPRQELPSHLLSIEFDKEPGQVPDFMERVHRANFAFLCAKSSVGEVILWRKRPDRGAD